MIMKEGKRSHHVVVDIVGFGIVGSALGICVQNLGDVVSMGK